MTTIALFSTKEELEVLQKREDFDYLRLIALTPEADMSLENFPERRKNIEDYYSEKELNIIGNNSLQKIQEICDLIDEKHVSSETKFSCSDVYMFIKLLYDQLLVNHTFCKEILIQEIPKKVIIFNLNHLSETILCESNDDLFINFIYYFFHIQKKISCEILYCQKKIVDKKAAFIPRKIFHVESILSILKFKIENFLWRLLNFKKNSIYVLQHYDFEVCKNLRKKFKMYWDHKKNAKLTVCVDTSFNKIVSNQMETSFKETLDKHFTFDSISYYSLIEPKIEYLIYKMPCMFNKIIFRYVDMYKNKKIKIIMAASGQSLEILAGIKAANICKIPVVWGQHGGFYGYADFPILDYLHNNYSYYFLYTKSIFVINNYLRCFSVSDSKLLKIYRAKRGQGAD